MRAFPMLQIWEQDLYGMRRSFHSNHKLRNVQRSRIIRVKIVYLLYFLSINPIIFPLFCSVLCRTEQKFCAVLLCFVQNRTEILRCSALFYAKQNKNFALFCSVLCKTEQKFCAVLRAMRGFCSVLLCFARLEMILLCSVLRKIAQNRAKQSILRDCAKQGTSLIPS